MDIRAYTDGACSGNPGPGGWGVVLIASKRGEIIKEKELSGGELETTNNRMELRAAIEALRALTTPSPITIVTDSVYVKDGITKWVANWQKNGWKTANKKPVKNQELWQDLVEALAPHNVHWEWVKGHDGHPENERADRLARQFQENYLADKAKRASESSNTP